MHNTERASSLATSASVHRTAHSQVDLLGGMVCSVCEKTGHNIKACPALKDADRDVEAKQNDLAIAKEKRALLLSRIEKAENKNRKKAMHKSTMPSAEQVTGTDSCRGTDSEPGDEVPREKIDVPTTNGLPTEF